MKQYGIGIIGMGFMGKAHSYAHTTLPFYYQNLPYTTKLITACNRSPGAAEYAASRLGFVNATTNEDDIFNNPEIDIVHVCTPNEAHFEQCKKAFLSNKHIYCDKPLTVTHDESLILSNLEKESNVTSQVAFHNRFFPATLRAKQLIDEGRIGDILCFRCEYLHSGAIDPNRPVNWKHTESGGVLLDLGSHAIDLMYHLLGEFKSVYCTRRTLHPLRKTLTGESFHVKVEDHFNILAKLPCGASGTIESSKIATGIDDELRFEIHGSRGAIRFNLMQPNTLWFYDCSKPEGVYGGERGFTAIECTARYAPPGNQFPSFKNAIGWIRAHCHSLYTFLENVYNNRPGDPSFADAAYTQLIMKLALDSSIKDIPMEI